MCLKRFKTMITKEGDQFFMLSKILSFFYIITLVKKNQINSYYNFLNTSSIVTMDQLTKFVNIIINESLLF